MSESIKVETLEKLTIIKLNAPERRNALSVEMRSALLSALDRCIADQNCRVIILAGEGKHFCAGGDLRNASGVAPDPKRTQMNVALLQDIVRRIVGPKPVLAAVEGAAYGAGMSLAVACDFVIASESAIFCTAFAKVGLSADAGLSWTLPHRIGLIRSRQLLITAETLSASAAVGIGLADRRVPVGTALENAIVQANNICELAPLTIASVKLMLNRYPYALQAALDIELEHQVRLTSTSDYAEGKRAFSERRPAVFRGE